MLSDSDDDFYDFDTPPGFWDQVPDRPPPPPPSLLSQSAAAAPSPLRLADTVPDSATTHPVLPGANAGEEDEDQLDDETCAAVVESAALAEDPHKRNRGRPKKQVQQEVDKQPKKRGRPPLAPGEAERRAEERKEKAKEKRAEERAERAAQEEEERRQEEQRREERRQEWRRQRDAAAQADLERFPHPGQMRAASTAKATTQLTLLQQLANRVLPASSTSSSAPRTLSASVSVSHPAVSTSSSSAPTSAPTSTPSPALLPHPQTLSATDTSFQTSPASSQNDSDPRPIESTVPLATPMQGPAMGGEFEELLGDEGVNELDEGEDGLGGGEDDEEQIGAPATSHRWVHPAWLQPEFVRWREWLKSTYDKGSGTWAVHRALHDDSDPKKLGLGSFFLPRPQLHSRFSKDVIPHPETLYTPRFFYWDPFPLLSEPARCPHASCNGKPLSRHGFCDRPRRACDLDETVYLFGQRYQCSRSGGCGKSFMAWDAMLLRQLPTTLRASFPFVLSHRGGCTEAVFRQLRISMSHSIGPKSFSSILHRQHLTYDERRRAYLQSIADLHFLHGNPLFDLSSPPAEYSPFSAFNDRDGYAGYVPSSKWFQLQYQRFMESKRQAIDQHTSLLTCTIGAIDHSHKIVKHIAKVDGQPVFSGLLSITNEFGELRVCSLVPTKAHDQFLPALQGVAASLSRYGHSPPVVFYTDNPRGDRNTLESAFTSLRQDLAPSPDLSPFSHLPLFPTPADIVVLDTAEKVDDAIGTIVLSVEDGASEAIGFDLEWNVEEDGLGRQQRAATTAVVQLAWRTKVFVIQFAKIARTHRSLPSSLRQLILNPQLLKVGVGIKSDLTLLLNDYAALQPNSHAIPAASQGAVDLGVLARSLSTSSSRKSSLDALVARFLKLYLPKPVSVRISTAWEDEVLPPEHVEYAARDAAASLSLYHHLEAFAKRARGAPLPPLLAIPGSRALVAHSDETSLVAVTTILLLGTSGTAPPPDFDPSLHPKITATSALLRVDRVLVPGALAMYPKRTGRTTFDSFGAVPFYLVVKLAQLRSPDPEQGQEGEGLEGETPDTGREITGEGVPEEGASGGWATLAAVGRELDGDVEELEEDDLSAAQADEESLRSGQALLDSLLSVKLPTSAPSDYHLPLSRVLIDPWHLMDRIPLSRRHGCLAAFMRAFADTLFVFDPKDKALLSARLSRLGLSFDIELLRRRKWVLQRCRRTIPPPDELAPLLAQLFKTFGPLKDAKTSSPLFNKAAWSAVKRIIKDVQEGLVSDPPDVELYTVVGECRGSDGTLDDGVVIYRCSRGTNMTEGGVHRNIRQQFAYSAASLPFADARLLDYRLVHNLVVGTANRTGKRFNGHFDIWTTNKIQSLANLVAPLIPAAPRMGQWLNTDMYEPSQESFTILPIPATTAAQLSISLHPSHPAFPPPSLSSTSSTPISAPPPSSKKRKTAAPERHAFLASKQGSRFAILHLHTRAERELYSELITSTAVVAVSGARKWLVMAQRWNERADGREVFYKMPTHLQHYSSHIDTLHNRQVSLQTSTAARAAFTDAARSLSRTTGLAEPPVRPSSPLKVARGKRPQAETAVASEPQFRKVTGGEAEGAFPSPLPPS
ncbi:hypothetical protein JCM5296_006594 [Sporobolomyces johnsonii]